MFETKEGVIKPIVYVGIVKGGKLLLVDYKTAPNPQKKGWWIPAPNLEFGADPQETAEKMIEELGIKPTTLKLHGVESFTMPGGWHLIYHYISETSGEPKAHVNIERYRWVSEIELSEMSDIAHGKWEIGVGKSFLSS
jgi:ADP-ribose pyrophosphatase YjhB (NUDIX family)